MHKNEMNYHSDGIKISPQATEITLKKKKVESIINMMHVEI